MPPVPLIEPDWEAPASVVAFNTTRQGGHSQGCFHSLNLGHRVGDDTAAVAANRALLAPQLQGSVPVWLQQTHSITAIELHPSHQKVSDPNFSLCHSADASWTATPGVACAILTADCLPVLLCDRRGTRVAAAHAGWRGLAAGILEATIAGMGVAPDSLLAWLGPAIGPAAFEVGAEVKAAFVDTATRSRRAVTRACFTPGRRANHYLADIYQLARLRLQSAGVTSISGGERCTVSEPQEFFSYRRDGQTGRMASLIYLEHA